VLLTYFRDLRHYVRMFRRDVESFGWIFLQIKQQRRIVCNWFFLGVAIVRNEVRFVFSFPPGLHFVL
jgi:hypothetical protein